MTPHPTRAGAPAAEPLALADVLPHVKEYGDAGEVDAYLTRLISVARRLCEERAECTLLSTPWVLRLDAFPPAIALLQGPVLEVTAVTYVDADGTEQTLDLADVQLDATARPAWLLPAPGTTWPATQAGRLNAVTIAYTAGFGDTPAHVPEPLRQWMLVAIQHMHNERGWDVPENFAPGLLGPFRRYGV